MVDNIISGLQNVTDPVNFLILLGGILIGFLGGGIPGISGTMLIIVLLPLSYSLDPNAAFLLLTSIYAISVFSGSISAILFRTPGTPESVATVLDGFPMAQKGKGSEALGIAITSSAIGGIIGTFFLILSSPLLASFALKFSSPEYFALALLGLTVVASLSGKSLVKGLISVLLGLIVMTIGIDPIDGTNRFTFGSNNLMSGLDFIPILIGLFAVSEVLRKVQEKNTSVDKKKVKASFPGKEIFKKLWATIARSTLLGTFIGLLPGVGATTASMLSYSQEANRSKNKENFGKGAPEGIAAPETANNAAAMGAIIPLLSLGIPGSATTAVLLGAFIMQGIQPGPLMFKDQSELMYTIFIGLLLSNILILILSKPFIRLFTQILRAPYSIIGPFIIIFCIVGAFSVRNSIFDVGVMLAAGVVGYFLEKGEFPLAPIVLGLVLGPLAEQEFRRAMQISGNDISIFVERPISLILLILVFVSLIVPFLKHFIKGSRIKGG